jgi:uncharacterized membrane protein (DUF485 family)
VQRPFVTSAGPDYLAIQHSPEFRRLRRDIRRLQFCCALLLVGPIVSVALLGAFRPTVLTIPVLGTINLGIALCSAIVAWALGMTAFYLRRFRTRIDPQITHIRVLTGLAPE